MLSSLPRCGCISVILQNDCRMTFAMQGEKHYSKFRSKVRIFKITVIPNNDFYVDVHEWEHASKHRNKSSPTMRKYFSCALCVKYVEFHGSPNHNVDKCRRSRCYQSDSTLLFVGWMPKVIIACSKYLCSNRSLLHIVRYFTSTFCFIQLLYYLNI